jgi:drug/metabolite transporter (DMT)-like permease
VDKYYFQASLQLALAQVAIGVNVIVGKLVIGVMPTHLFLCIRFLMSSIFLFIIFSISGSKLISSFHPVGRFGFRDLGFLLAQALTAGFLFNVLFFWGIDYTTATSAAIIGSTLPAFIAICAFLCLGEKLGFNKIFGISLAMIGILVVSLDNSHGGDEITGSYFGDAIVLLSMVPEALYSVFNKFSGHRITPLGGALVVNFLTFLLLLPLAVLNLNHVDLADFSLTTWALVSVGGLSSLFFFWFWSKGLLVIPTSTAALYGGLMPVAASVLAFLFLHENFGWYDFGGMVIVFISLVIGSGGHLSIIKKIRAKFN